MAVSHKFQNYDWKNGFWTEDSILKNNHYEPEVIFIGTFNHGWSFNLSDFFYGRGMYMWPIMANLFLNNQNIINTVRNFNNDNPTLDEIFEICKKGKLIFADIVKGTNKKAIIEEFDNHVRVVNIDYMWKDYKDTHLNRLGIENLLDDNTDQIIKYINSTPSIKHVYFTFKTGGNWILNKKKHISNEINIDSCSVFTPSANGFGQNLVHPFNSRLKSLTHCWVWNSLENPIPINRIGYCNLSHNWLIRNGVNPNNF